MRVVISGAGGPLGQILIPVLSQDGVDILLVDEDPDRLKLLYPSLAVRTYDEVERYARGSNAFVHLYNNARPDSELSLDIGVSIHAEIPLLLRILPHSAETELTHPMPELDDKDQLEIADWRVMKVFGSGARENGSLPGAIAGLIETLRASFQPSISAKKLAAEICRAAEIGSCDDRLVSGRGADNWVFRIVKRAMDFGFAIAVILLLWWLLAVAWVCIRLTSKGPGIFAQTRVGEGGRLFTCFKFRTMWVDTSQTGTHEQTKSSVTPFGRFLRRSKIDELPQVWNILKGDMSLIGPRPCLPSQMDVIREREALGVNLSRVGITGWSQIHQIDMSMPEHLAQSDAYYLDHSHIGLEMQILIATFLGRGRGDRTT